MIMRFRSATEFFMLQLYSLHNQMRAAGNYPADTCFPAAHWEVILHSIELNLPQ